MSPPYEEFPARSGGSSIGSDGFIVYCDCATRPEREEIADAVVRIGGSVSYIYDLNQSLAITSPAGRPSDVFAARVREIPGVVQVIADRPIEIHS